MCVLLDATQHLVIQMMVYCLYSTLHVHKKSVMCEFEAQFQEFMYTFPSYGNRQDFLDIQYLAQNHNFWFVL